MKKTIIVFIVLTALSSCQKEEGFNSNLVVKQKISKEWICYKIIETASSQPYQTYNAPNGCFFELNLKNNNKYTMISCNSSGLYSNFDESGYWRVSKDKEDGETINILHMDEEVSGLDDDGFLIQKLTKNELELLNDDETIFYLKKK